MLLLSLVFLFVISKLAASKEKYIPNEEYIPNEVLVKFKKSVDKYIRLEAIQSIQGKIITCRRKVINFFDWDPEFSAPSFPGDPGLFHIKVPEIIGTEQAINILSRNPNVKYAVKNAILYLQEFYPYLPFIYPNDEYFDSQWGLLNWFPFLDEANDISATYAWVIFTGSSDIVVAVIDSGVDYEHIDLEDNIWTNVGETGLDQWGNPKETNGIDDDDNEYIDDVHGYNFLWEEGDPPAWRNPMDYFGHGTHCAGIIGAVGNNEEGVAGVNWTVKIMSLKAGDESGMSLDAIIKSIDYATDMGAHLSNNSYAGSGHYPPLYEAIERAMNAGRLFIAAAGNYPDLPWRDNDEQPVYPASYGDNRRSDKLENIISVAATDIFDRLSDFSHYGANSVDLGAPGGSNDIYEWRDIYSTIPNDGYAYKVGTSMATPFVAGVAALVWGYRLDLNWSQVKNAIMSSVDLQGSLTGKTVSEGRLNAYEALLVYPRIPEAPSNLNTVAKSPNRIDLSWEDNSNNEDVFKIERKISGGSFSQIATVGKNVSSYSDTSCNPDTTYCYRVRAWNSGGNSSYSNTACATTFPEDPEPPEKPKPPKPPIPKSINLELTVDKIVINPGESVTFTYTIANIGGAKLVNVVLEDSFGRVAEISNLPSTEKGNYTRIVTLFKSTTNTATVTAFTVVDDVIKIRGNVNATKNIKIEVRR